MQVKPNHIFSPFNQIQDRDEFFKSPEEKNSGQYEERGVKTETKEEVTEAGEEIEDARDIAEG